MEQISSDYPILTILAQPILDMTSISHTAEAAIWGIIGADLPEFPRALMFVAGFCPAFDPENMDNGAIYGIGAPKDPSCEPEREWWYNGLNAAVKRFGRLAREAIAQGELDLECMLGAIYAYDCSYALAEICGNIDDIGSSYSDEIPVRCILANLPGLRGRYSDDVLRFVDNYARKMHDPKALKEGLASIEGFDTDDHCILRNNFALAGYGNGLIAIHSIIGDSYEDCLEPNMPNSVIGAICRANMLPQCMQATMDNLDECLADWPIEAYGAMIEAIKRQCDDDELRQANITGFKPIDVNAGEFMNIIYNWHINVKSLGLRSLICVTGQTFWAIIMKASPDLGEEICHYLAGIKYETIVSKSCLSALIRQYSLAGLVTKIGKGVNCIQSPYLLRRVMEEYGLGHSLCRQLMVDSFRAVMGHKFPEEPDDSIRVIGLKIIKECNTGQAMAAFGNKLFSRDMPVIVQLEAKRALDEYKMGSQYSQGYIGHVSHWMDISGPEISSVLCPK